MTADDFDLSLSQRQIKKIGSLRPLRLRGVKLKEEK
jgi:hypothetical protein